jgi:hypothetical protein
MSALRQSRKTLSAALACVALASPHHQISQICASAPMGVVKPAADQIGGFACACPFADSHGPLRVALSDTAVDRPVRIGQDGGAVSSVVIDRSRMVLMERCRLILR